MLHYVHQLVSNYICLLFGGDQNGEVEGQKTKNKKVAKAM